MRRGRRGRIASLWPRSWSGRRALRAIRAAPLAIRILVGVVVVLAVWSAVNGAYQVIRKPTELLFPVSRALAKTPPETWRRYGPLFRAHATAVITPELLAALAQVEGGGNPMARTPWRWRLTWNPFELYQPASSAVGMYQITDATFREGRRYCIHDHAVVEDGPWYDVTSCWFNRFYTRVVPSHAVELTAALLDRGVASTVERQRIATATLQQKHDLAGVIHLCGAGPGEAYARRGFRLTAGQRCGAHDVRGYLAEVNAMKRRFVRLAAADSPAGEGSAVSPGRDRYRPARRRRRGRSSRRARSPRPSGSYSTGRAARVPGRIRGSTLLSPAGPVKVGP